MSLAYLEEVDKKPEFDSRATPATAHPRPIPGLTTGILGYRNRAVALGLRDTTKAIDTRTRLDSGALRDVAGGILETEPVAHATQVRKADYRSFQITVEWCTGESFVLDLSGTIGPKREGDPFADLHDPAISAQAHSDEWGDGLSWPGGLA